VGSHSLSFLFRLVAVLHDVAGLEEDALRDLAPFPVPTQQKLEIHAEMLEFLVLRVPHDGSRLAVLLQGEALLVPADRFRFFDERR